MKNFRKIAAVSLATALALSACGSNGDEDSSSKGNLVTITVGASPVPHAKILKYIQDNLAAEAGIEIEIKEYQGYVQPNVALDGKEIDANFFQHLPYLEEDSKANKYNFEHGEGVHIEPYGIYSKKINNLSDLPNNAKIAITNDPSNQARALKLLVANNIITLKDVESPTIYDVAENPKNVTFTETEAPTIPSLLPDVDLGIINGNYALEHNLNPAKDALYLEDGKDNPYSNILVWNPASDENKVNAVKKLDQLLHSEKVAQYIRDNWKNGEVIPAF